VLVVTVWCNQQSHNLLPNLFCVQSTEKLSSPVGSMIEGLNKEPADANGASQFRSPLLRQMMGNKLASATTAGRPTSGSYDVTVSGSSENVTASLVHDSTTAEETITSTELRKLFFNKIFSLACIPVC